MDYQEELNQLIEVVIAENASDLHLTANYRPTIRIDGNLNPLLKKEVLTSEDTRHFLEVLLSEENLNRFLKNKEVDFSYSYGEKARFRGNAYYSKGSIGIALRLIPGNIQTLEELNLPNILEKFARRQQGFFLVVGPVGQGKSTTLASMIEIINQTRAEHILTIEDPIEFLYKPAKSVIDQREVRVDTDDFHSALRSMFRQDIDVALIGEMRSVETMSAAVTAAETGHLIFSTLHTNNAAQTIDRVIDSFPAEQQQQIRMQLAGSLIGIFSQRLIPRVSGGQIPAYELLINNNAVSNLIREGRTHEIQTVIETGLDDGMVDLNRSLAELVRQGEITPDQARLYSLTPQVLERML